jgi:hypothetical protein
MPTPCPSTNTPTTRTFLKMQGFDLAAQNIQNIAFSTTGTAQEDICLNSCKANISCNAVMIDTTAKVCYLKNNNTNVKPVSASTWKTLFYETTPSTTNPPATTRTFTRYPGKDLSGQDIQAVPLTTTGTAAETFCLNACQSNPSCNAALVEPTAQLCYLKNNRTGATPTASSAARVLFMQNI